MLQLKKITKDYKLGDGSFQRALKGINANFRKNEFVAILGQSGCGKTTMLNIIGGLDHYTTGDLIIDNKSTKNFKDKDWDNYRNKSIGFVFQSYNLIAHQNILNNVAMGLTLAGVKKSERVNLAKKALEKVGLGNSLKKKPNQLSGGQMQRVAIARAIVGNPDIILADEPTGALDSETGVQVMEILKEIAKDKLVIMVTHNAELANTYANRIITMFDGKLVDDSNPYLSKDLKNDYKNNEKTIVNDKIKKKKVSMNLKTAFALSGQTLKEKKGRTFITSFAGSIGIFAITLVLAISAGMNNYVDNMQKTALGTSAITISETTIDLNNIRYPNLVELTEYPTQTTGIYPYTQNSQIQTIKNNLTDEFLEYIENMDKSFTSTIEYSYSTKMNIITNTQSGYKLLTTKSSSSGFGGMGGILSSSWYDVSSQALSNSSLITENYDILYKTTETGLPTNKNELTLVVDKYNRLTTTMLDALGIDYNENLDSISYQSITEKTFKLIPNNLFYFYDGTKYTTKTTSSEYEVLFNDDNAETLKIVGIIRLKNDDATEWLSSGIVYSSELTDYVLNDAKTSNIGVDQIASTTKNVLTGEVFVEKTNSSIQDQYNTALKNLGIVKTPTSISLYPSNIDAKDDIVNYLDNWNTLHQDNKIVYTDIAQILMDILSSLINVISYILIAFCAISLVVSTVMISVTTYTSVVERTKEIGVLRSLGARKKDISRIFNAETIIIGGFAGIIGVVFAGFIGLVVNIVLNALVGVSSIVNLKISTALIMIFLSTFLTWLAGLIPARIAANKDPVLCLRTE